MQYTEVRTLYNQAPILSTLRIAEMLQVTHSQLKRFCIKSYIASPRDFNWRSHFISYSLSGKKMARCRYCGIKAKNFCDDCIERFKPDLYDNSISWQQNMKNEGWELMNNGWSNKHTGRYLRKGYQKFFMENEVLP